MKKKFAVIFVLLALCSGLLFTNREVIFAESEDIKSEKSEVKTVADNLTAEEFEAICKTASAQDIRNLLSEKRLSADVMLKGKNDNGEEYQTPLFLCAINSNSNIEIIKTLISLGADVNVRNGRALLNTKSPDIVALLLENGADLYAGDDTYEGNVFMRWLSYGESPTPIWYEIYEEKPKEEKTPKKPGEPLAIWDIHSYITYNLSEDRQEDILKIASLFIESGYDVNHKDKYAGRTVLVNAVKSLHYAMPEDSRLKPAIISMLIKAGADVNAEDSYGSTVLMYAIGDGMRVGARASDIAKTVSALIEAGADVNAQTKYMDTKGVTALMRVFAGLEVNEGIVPILLKAGANVSLKDERGQTALMYAANHPSSVELLLKAGADVNAKDNSGNTALMYAIREPSSVELLLKAGADVSMKNNDGETALFKAFKTGNSSAVKKLLEAGANRADVNIKDKDGQTITQKAFQPVKEALENPASMDLHQIKNFEKLAQLIDFGGTLSGCNVNAKSKRDLPILMELLLLARELNHLEAEDKTIIYLTYKFEPDEMRHVFSKIAKAMADAGADTEARDEKGNTLLFTAIKGGASDVVDSLISLGANVNTRDNSGATALMFASANKGAVKNPEILKALIKAGANVNAREDKGGATVLMLACLFGSPSEIIRELLNAGANPTLTDNRGHTAADYLLAYVKEQADKGEEGERLKDYLNSITEMLINAITSKSSIISNTSEASPMPEATVNLAREYFECMYYNVSNLTEHFRDILDRLYAGVGGEGEYNPEVYGDYTQGMEKSISELRNRKPYTQEQAINAIGRMIDSGKFPANYILAKGQYKYAGNINAVVTTTNVNLRSQPNANARILCVISGPAEMDGGPAGDICSYMGEWTNPQGDRWVAVKFHHYEEGDFIGWLSGKYTQFITNSQVMEIARAYERAKAAPRRKFHDPYN